MDEQSDLLVIGGGPGGVATANRAARHGARVTLFESRALGGTCVNRGCVPKKAMWFAAELADAQRMAKAVGFGVEPGALDWPAFLEHREAYMARARKSYADGMRERGVRVVAHHARFVDARTLRAGDTDYRAPHIVIAAGSRPRPLRVPGGDLVIDSDGFFALRERPSRVGIIGGGYIAVELAGMLCALGAKVEVFSESALLAKFDADLGRALAGLMQTSGISLHERCAAQAVVRDADGLRMDCADGARHGPYDCVISAIGRVPNSEALAPGAAGIAVGDGGAIGADEFENTSVEGIHAIGDINNKRPLTPVAVAAGRRLADRLFGGDAHARLDYGCVPSVVFSHPPIGTVGLSEAGAREKFGDAVRVHTGEFAPMLWALAGREGKTKMKLVCTGDDERIVGLHGIGPGMDEILQGFAVAVRMGARYVDFRNTVAIHPTSAEEFVTMA